MTAHGPDKVYRDPDDTIHPFADLRPTGLLWLINATVFHPRGLAMALEFHKDGTAMGWSLQVAGPGEPFTFLDCPEVDAAYVNAERTMAEAKLAATEDPEEAAQVERIQGDPPPETSCCGCIEQAPGNPNPHHTFAPDCLAPTGRPPEQPRQPTSEAD